MTFAESYFILSAERHAKGDEKPMDETREKQEGRKPLRGIRIKTFNFWIILAACLLYVALIYETVSISGKYQDLQDVSELYIACQQDAAMVREGSDYLTEQVRLYTVTGDRAYMDRYFEEADVTRRRDEALAELAGHDLREALTEELTSALHASNTLMEREIYAMKLICTATGTNPDTVPEQVRTAVLTGEDLALSPQEQMEKGRSLVFDEEYQQMKGSIMGHIENFSAEVLSGARRLRTNTAQELEQLLKHQRALISALFVLTVLTFIFITVLIVKPLTIYANCIKDDKLFEIVGAYEFKYLAVTYNDIYELNAANEAMLQKQAETDPLTGLINRRALDRQLAVLKNSKKPVALLLVDVDNFKTVNDVHGHAVGDQVLKKVAGLLAQSFRSTDRPARIGGDEFAVLLMGTTYQQRERIGQKVEELNQRLQDPDDGLPPVSLSVGGAFSHQGYVDELYHQADEALYRVKEAGRRGCDFTAPSDGQ